LVKLLRSIFVFISINLLSIIALTSINFVIAKVSLAIITIRFILQEEVGFPL
jgi:hypothetical protein